MCTVYEASALLVALPWPGFPDPLHPTVNIRLRSFTTNALGFRLQLSNLTRLRFVHSLYDALLSSSCPCTAAADRPGSVAPASSSAQLPLTPVSLPAGLPSLAVVHSSAVPQRIPQQTAPTYAHPPHPRRRARNSTATPTHTIGDRHRPIFATQSQDDRVETQAGG